MEFGTARGPRSVAKENQMPALHRMPGQEGGQGGGGGLWKTELTYRCPKGSLS